MVEPPYPLVWTARSQQNLRQVFNHIKQDSLQNAEKVVKDIVDAVEKTIHNPERYNPDKYKINNDGTYRAFEKHRYRISYRFSKGVVRVLRVRHTSRHPNLY